jgi:release factor glutamine methyltransferase
MELEYSEKVYSPDEDTFLIEENLKRTSKRFRRALEIGTGTGYLALLLARISKKVVASDIEDTIINLAKRNALRNGLKNIEFVKSELFNNIEGTFDFIIFNPPYLPGEIPESSYIERAIYGGQGGLEIIVPFLKSAKKFLRKNGLIWILISSLSDITTFRKFLVLYNYRYKIIDLKRLFFEVLYLYELSSE